MVSQANYGGLFLGMAQYVHMCAQEFDKKHWHTIEDKMNDDYPNVFVDLTVDDKKCTNFYYYTTELLQESFDYVGFVLFASREFIIKVAKMFNLLPHCLRARELEQGWIQEPWPCWYNPSS